MSIPNPNNHTDPLCGKCCAGLPHFHKDGTHRAPSVSRGHFMHKQWRGQVRWWCSCEHGLTGGYRCTHLLNLMESINKPVVVWSSGELFADEPTAPHKLELIDLFE